MGSNKSRARKKHGKPVHAQHLPKVGTPAEMQQHGERDAVLDNLGLGGASNTSRLVLGIVAVLVVAAAVIGLIILSARY
jgi:hypothetical protein